MSLATLAPVISGLAWTVTYAGVVTRTYKDKTPGMPLAALCLNFAWETTYSIIYPPQSSLVETLINVVWMILDALIVIGMLRFGPKDYQQRLGISKGTFYATFALGLAASFGVMLLGPSYFGGLPAFHHDSFEVAKFIALLQNCAMSMLFLSQFYSRKRFDNPIAGQSFTIAWSKWLGTSVTVGLVTVLADPTGFMAVIVGLTFVCDTWYMLAIYGELKRQGVSPWRRL
jgi:hypothetical protein